MDYVTSLLSDLNASGTQDVYLATSLHVQLLFTTIVVPGSDIPIPLQSLSSPKFKYVLTQIQIRPK